MIGWMVNWMIASMIFFPDKALMGTPQDYGLIFEEVHLPTQDNHTVHGWYVPAPEAKFTLLFLHGNAGNMSHRLPKAQEWVKRGVSVLLIDYRSYGQSKGALRSDMDLLVDARAARTWLVEKGIDTKDVVVYGESIGANPAIRIAVESPVRALILEAPFTSLKDMAKKHYGVAPDFFFQGFQMDNESAIQGIHCPVMIIHGTQDEVVPYEMGKRLFEKASSPKELFTIEGGTHNELSVLGGAEFYDRPLHFVLKNR